MIVPPFETVYITWPDYDYEYLELSVNESTHIHVKCLLWFSKLHNWWKELTFIMLNILLRGYKNNCQWSNERTWNVWNWHQIGSFQSPPPPSKTHFRGPFFTLLWLREVLSPKNKKCHFSLTGNNSGFIYIRNFKKWQNPVKMLIIISNN